MHKLFLLLIFCINLFKINAQNIELSAGLNNNYYHDNISKEEKSYFETKYNSGIGYTFGTSLEFSIDSFPLKFTFKYDSYNGEINTSFRALPGNSTTAADVSKHC